MEGLKKEIPHAFVQVGKNGQKYMLKRRGRNRYPVDIVTLPINGQGEHVVENDVFPRVEERLLRAFEHELRWEVSK